MWRHSAWDSVLVLLAVAHGCALVLRPSLWLIAVGLWWNSNTIAHYFLHLPFFRSRLVNLCFDTYLSVLLGVPQRLWRERHLAHHSARPWRFCLSRTLVTQSGLVGLLWAALLWRSPAFFWKTYLPGWLLGLGLCQVQGYYEHSHGTTSHYSWIYNLLFFNDGFHVEHHARPNAHWTTLPQWRSATTPGSLWPACLRWLDWLNLESMEKMVLRWPFLQRLVLHWHRVALRKLLPQFRDARTIVIVGGALFPRTALILLELLPKADITIIDQNTEHIRMAARFLSARVKFVHGFYPVNTIPDADLTVIPLSLMGDRQALRLRDGNSTTGSGPLVLVHDWLWRRCGQSVVVSIVLLKRINLIKA